jgi:hypothetical protein
LTKGIGYTVETDREFKLEFSCPEDVVLDGRLADKNGAYIEGTAFAVRDQSTTSVIFRAPKPGDYVANVGVWLRKEAFDSIKGVLTFKIHYRGGTEGRQPFPLLYIDYFLNDSQLLNPFDGVLIKGSVQMFRVKTSGDVKVAVYINNQMRELNKGADGVFSLSVRVPDTSEIILYAQKPGGTYRGIVHYLVR